MKYHSRRQFIQNASLLAAGAGLASAFPFTAIAASNRKIAPSDKVVFGVIGLRNMGWENLKMAIKIPEVEVLALCDVDNSILQSKAAELEKMTGKKPVLYSDFRKLLENKDIDAVIIGTPDHWHCLNLVYACEAGKDVYVEKPLGRTIEECNIMVAATKRYNRVVQVGQWQRSGPHWQSALDFIHSGKLGKISLVKTWIYNGGMQKLAAVPDGPVPDGVDYDMWLGPAPKRAFNKNRFHGTFRYFWDYAGGMMADWGVHLLDIAFLGMKANVAKSVTSTGGKYTFPDSGQETPDTQQAIYEFNDFSVMWEHGVGMAGRMYGTDHHGVAFMGTNGTLVIDRNKWQLFPETRNGQFAVPAMPTQNGNNEGLAQHHVNFVNCIKSRQKPNCDIESARDVAVNANLANIALRTGRKVYWNEAKDTFGDDKIANAYIKANYQNNWKLPKV